MNITAKRIFSTIVRSIVLPNIPDIASCPDVPVAVMEPQNTNLESLPILQTKLFRPHVSKDIVPRPHLMARLQQATNGSLILVSAPAGYGKSTLISNWLDELDHPSAWLSLDEHDSSLPIFLNYLLAAIQTAFPELALKTRSLLYAPSIPPAVNLARSLINDLDRLETPFVLVLDDVHFIQEMAVYEFLGELLRHPPRTTRLALVTRVDPPLNLNSLRAKRRMIEIRLSDLSFSQAETSTFMNDTMGFSMDRAKIARLRHDTEGWVTALRLAALSLRNQKDVDKLLGGLHGSNRYLQDYLVAEVVSRQPPIVQDWLLKISILDRFSAPLCEAVCLGADQVPNSASATAPRRSDTNSAQAGLSGLGFIQWLETTNLLLIPLDTKGEWFRFHHLFQHLNENRLAERLRPDEIAALHVRASEWFAQNDLIEEALEHALIAGDESLPLQLVRQHRRDIVNLEHWHRLDQWLQLFSGTAFEEHPEISVLNLWRIGYRRAPSQVILDLLDLAENQMAQTPMEQAAASQLEGEISFLRCYQHGMMVDAQQSNSYAQRALDILPYGNHGIVANLHTVFALGTFHSGLGGEAQEYIDRELGRAPSHNHLYHARLLLAPCLMHWWRSNLSGLAQSMVPMLKHAQDSGQPESLAIARFVCGCFHYSRNELTEVEEHLAEIVRDFVGSENYIYYNASLLVFTYLAQGRADRAQNIIDSVAEFAISLGNSTIPPLLQAFQAELNLRQGRLLEAKRWAESYDPFPLGQSPRFYMPQLTLAKVLMAKGTPRSCSEAEKLLTQLSSFLQSIHVSVFLIDVLALQALLQNSQGDEPAALETLGQALALAEPGGFIRKFVDLGSEMSHLLQRLKQEVGVSSYVDHLLTAFPSSPSQTALVDPLTERELQVLQQLATDAGTQQIADTLAVSVGTLRTHIKRIYGKLDAHSRYEAVQLAESLNLL